MVATTVFHNSFSPLKCLQINLRHCKIASANLAQLILDLNIDLVLIQEPYAEQSNNPNPANIPPGYTSVHSLSMDHAYGAVILIKHHLFSQGRVKHTKLDNSATMIELSTTEGTLCFFSIYARPSLDSPVSLLSNLLNQSNCLVSRSVVAIDANAKNSLWNSATTDRKGKDLESFILARRLTVANKNKSSLEFIPPNTSFVDLTLVGDCVNVKKWVFLSFETFSDHPYIYFEIVCKSRVNAATVKTVPKLPAIAAIDEQAFRTHLKNKLKEVAPISLPLSNEIVTSSVQELCELIAEAATVSKKPRLLSVARGKMPWWSHALCALRTKTRHALKQWSNSKTIENRDAYVSCKSNYQRELRTAKKNSFQELSDKSGKDLFKVLKNISGKCTTVPLPTEITADGCTLNQPVKILEACARHFFS